MRTTLVFSVGLAVLLSGAADAQRIHSVYGSRVDLTLLGGRRLSGELLAARQDSVWVLPRRAKLSVLSLSDIARARVPRTGPSAGGMLVWALVGGTVSGLALTAACSSVDGADCGGLLPAMIVSWGLVGGIAAAITGSGSRPVNVDARGLAPYARFPQGLPPGFTPAP